MDALQYDVVYTAVAQAEKSGENDCKHNENFWFAELSDKSYGHSEDEFFPKSRKEIENEKNENDAER